MDFEQVSRSINPTKSVPMNQSVRFKRVFFKSSYLMLNEAKKGVVILLLFISCQSIAQEWRLQGSGTRMPLWSVFFTDTLRGWAVGKAGTILHTTNGGIQWINQQSPDTVNTLCSVYFLDSLTGWAVGGKGVIFTTDGGMNWISKNVGIDRCFWDITFVDRSIGWIVGSKCGSSGVILRTDDGGSTWRILVDTAENGGYRSVHFANHNEGWIVGFNGFDNRDPDIILHSTNGGVSWSDQVSPKVGGLSDVAFKDSSIGYAVGLTNVRYAVVKTTDGGATWILAGPKMQSMNRLWSIAVGDPQDILAVGEYLSRSRDGGVSWTLETLEQPKSIGGVFSIDRNNSWACGDSGSIWKYIPTVAEARGIDNPGEKELNIRIYSLDNGNTITIEYMLEKQSFLSAVLYDMIGRNLAIITNQMYSAGRYVVSFNTNAYMNGAYILRTQQNDTFYYQKILILH